MKPEAGIYCCLSFWLPAVPVESPATRLCVCLTVSSSPFSFHHFPLLTVLHFLPFSLCLSVLTWISVSLALLSFRQGVNWKPWKGHLLSLDFTEMKIRPVGTLSGRKRRSLMAREKRRTKTSQWEPQQPSSFWSSQCSGALVTHSAWVTLQQYVQGQWGGNSCAIVTYYVL